MDFEFIESKEINVSSGSFNVRPPSYFKTNDSGLITRLTARQKELAPSRISATIKIDHIALSVVREVRTEASPSVAFARTTPELPEFVFTQNAQDRYGDFLQAALEALPRRAEIQVFRIGDTALVGLPGEPLVEVGRAVAGAMAKQGLERTMVLGLANDYIGYLVNEKEYAHGGYEVDSRSYYGPELGAFMAEQSGRTAASLMKGVSVP